MLDFLVKEMGFEDKTEPLRASTSGNINVDRNSTVVIGDILGDDAEDLSEIDTDSKVELIEPSAPQNESPHDEQKHYQNKYIVNIKQIEKGLRTNMVPIESSVCYTASVTTVVFLTPPAWLSVPLSVSW